MIIEKITNKEAEPINFERPLSQAYWYGKVWSREVPDSVRVSVEGLRAMNRTLEPEEIEEASHAVLGFCDFATGVIHLSSPKMHKKQIKLFIGCRDDIWGRALEALSNSHARVHKHFRRITLVAVSAQSVLRNLEAMLKEEDEPDFLHRPSEYAYNTARQIIENSYSHYLGSPPTPAIAPDGEGGIITEWKSGQRVVRLIVGASQNKKSYVYSRGIDQSTIDHSASGSVLAQRLRSVFVN